MEQQSAESVADSENQEVDQSEVASVESPGSGPGSKPESSVASTKSSKTKSIKSTGSTWSKKKRQVSIPPLIDEYAMHRKRLTEIQAVVDTKPVKVDVNSVAGVRAVVTEQGNLQRLHFMNRRLLESIAFIFRTHGIVNCHLDLVGPHNKNYRTEAEQARLSRIARDNQAMLHMIRSTKGKYSCKEWSQDWNEAVKIMRYSSSYPLWWEQEQADREEERQRMLNALTPIPSLPAMDTRRKASVWSEISLASKASGTSETNLHAKSSKGRAPSKQSLSSPSSSDSVSSEIGEFPSRSSVIPESIKKWRAFLDFECVRGHNVEKLGRVVVQLRPDVVPVACRNFMALCRRTDGGYRGTYLDRIVAGVLAQGGHTVASGTGCGESAFGRPFQDENFLLLHDSPGTLSSSSCTPDSNGAGFILTLVPLPTLDGHHVVFGKVVAGLHVAGRLSEYGSASGKPARPVRISDCGMFEGELEDAEREGRGESAAVPPSRAWRKDMLDRRQRLLSKEKDVPWQCNHSRGGRPGKSPQATPASQHIRMIVKETKSCSRHKCSIKKKGSCSCCKLQLCKLQMRELHRQQQLEQERQQHELDKASVQALYSQDPSLQVSPASSVDEIDNSRTPSPLALTPDVLVIHDAEDARPPSPLGLVPDGELVIDDEEDARSPSS